jgi:BirA family transcriptional regulator, biotin operon repressor / biotin---[acetyl-CoA-carboxylase] ligase
VTAIAPSPAPVVRRQERLGLVGSTNDVVRGWLAAGEPEICVARADRQTAGRGRSGRTWTAPAGRGLLVSLGFRPTWLAPDRVWQLAATVSMAMADAARDEAGLPDGAIRLKWPNDLVVIDGRRDAELALPSPKAKATLPRAIRLRKLGGVLGETDGLGTSDPRAIVGVGVNADWAEADFPPELATTMTSLRATTADRPIDTGRLFDGFVARLETRVAALHGGGFDAVDWVDRQVTTGRDVVIQLPDGSSESVVATGVDPQTGALRIADPTEPAGERSIVVGEIVHVRLAGL